MSKKVRFQVAPRVFSDNYPKMSDLDIYPTRSEILHGERDFLKKNVVEGAYRSVDEYLDIHFTLLREDFVAPLRNSISKYRQGQKEHNLDVYKNVTVEQFSFKLNPRLNLQNLKDTKKFLNGSLLIFTKNNFRTYFFAKITRREEADFDLNEFYMEVVDGGYTGSNFTLLECRNFFEPYYQVLSALKKMYNSSFPLEKYIIKVETSKCLPKYILNSRRSYKIFDYSFPANQWSEFPKEISGLNESQFAAFKAALSQELAVIQGPPGTGKTYLGLIIVRVLLQNYHLWYKKTPILIISHKNHALDQFLEGILEFTKKIVRVGGQSKSDKLDIYNLNYISGREPTADIEERFTSLFVGNWTVGKRKKTDLEILQNALIVGMTTTAAARMKLTLEGLRSPIVIVEEAAEVLEAHVVAALTADCQHLIMLGDHFQLQPSTSDRRIGTHYKLGVSLFERMVNNGISCQKLTTQHRMRPQISKILKLTTYPFLEDHASVYNKEGILGVQQNVFFLDHQNPEESANVTSKKNIHEAKFVVAFAKYLIQNGYDPSDVTILTTYAGQVKEIGNQIRLLPDKQWLNDVSISTLDAFQGQESEIIILSLVRSKDIGFISAGNRICVAMSRAKNGFYMIGNMSLLSKNSKLWNVIKFSLEKDEAIGCELTLKCQKHTQMVTKVKSAEDFQKVPCGGCSKKCIGGELPCGHKCPLNCHILKHGSYPYKCKKMCTMKICLIHESERCKKLCCERCTDCTICSAIQNLLNLEDI